MTAVAAPFSEAIEDASRGNSKLPNSEFLPDGPFPVVDQGQQLVAGYADDPSLLCSVPAPVIVFGDHTRALKFIDFPFVIGAEGVKVLRVREGWDPKIVFHYLKFCDIPSAGYSRHFKFLKEVSVPRPPLDEQRRIAAILDQADALNAKRRQALARLDELTKATFQHMFEGRLDPTIGLSDIADVGSGITKGRRTSEPTSAIPYLAVSNVQAGYLKLDFVKEIDATTSEIDRYALRDGDLVLTEGGDPDKLGRGTVWRSELPMCLHQNHIFRVRIRDTENVLPDYLAAYLGGRDARAYFARSAKQTTGIASINMTQLRALPVAVPSVGQQEKFVQMLRAIAAQGTATKDTIARGDELMAALQSRAFRGDL